jgi:hypothetical protein
LYGTHPPLCRLPPLQDHGVALLATDIIGTKVNATDKTNCGYGGAWEKTVSENIRNEWNFLNWVFRPMLVILQIINTIRH